MRGHALTKRSHVCISAEPAGCTRLAKPRCHACLLKLQLVNHLTTTRSVIAPRAAPPTVLTHRSDKTAQGAAA
jgi:hypothetical protein